MSENLTQQASAYGQAAARALFAIEAGEKSLAEKLRKNLVNLQKNYDKEQAIIKNRIANDLSVHGLKFKRNLSALGRKDETVLAACEYLQVGKIALPEIGALDSSLGEIPFIVPMIGRGHLALAHRSDETRGLLADLVWKTIAATAPGQLQVITYNPDLRNQLSFLSNVEQFSTIISTDQLQALFDSTSREVLEVDSMLKGKYASLIELRRASNQPVGTLRLIVLQDIEFLSDERLRNQFCQLAESCARAGTCFVISDVINPQRLELLSNIQPLSLLEVQSPGQASSARFSCAVALDAGQRDFDAEVAAYIDKASNTSVVSIPFDEVEDVGNLWRDTTRDGITFAMGRSGLEVVTLRLGDEKTQSHNALITGAAGKGKSNLLEVIIHSICARYSPREIELYLLDFKDGLTFKPYSDNNDASSLPHARVLGLESEPDIGLATLEHIESIRRERAKTFKDAGDCKDIAQYRSKYPDRRMPRILAIIDEYQKLFENPDRIGLAAAGVLENLVRQGRACGIHVILSSQTITGAAALLGRTDNIYAQFPIRIALQNSLNESFATFVQGNDGAAKLRVRGEAILNRNYGDRDSNERFTVAFAQQEAMKNLRKKFYELYRREYRPPIVFRKNETFHLPSLFKSIKSWRRAVALDHAAPMVPCGVAISVGREQVSVRMGNDAGRNIALIGSGDDAQNAGLLSNDAIGVIQTIGISLALQHVDGNARFSLVNGIDKVLFDRNGMEDWLRLMERLGFPVETVDKDEAPAFFRGLAGEVPAPRGSGDVEAHYVLCLALDRCSTLSLAAVAPGEALPGNALFTPAAEKGTEAFQKVLQYGSARGTHVISWWNNAAIYKDHIGYQGDGFINTKMLLRVDNNTAQSVLGMLTNWAVQDNRALVHDSTDLEASSVVAPYKPVSKRDCGLVLSEDWNT